ncbi:MAG: NAD-dependent protein deacetylase [Armatimonadaceae bacterium]
MNTIKPISREQYKHIVFLTGAGISVASGLSTYRGPGGLWTKLDVARIANGDNLPGTLPDLWNLYRERRRQALAAQPNAAHVAIANLQRDTLPGRKVTLITQNVDGLHRRAGSDDVLEMHGSAFGSRCFERCGIEPFADESLHEGFRVPVCPNCGGRLRPDVVLFSESIPEAVLYRAVEALQECDLFIAVGTSGVVYPAAQFVEFAVRKGARTINVNVEASGNPSFAEEYPGPAEEILPRLFGTAP